jgi:hypothetical protein
MYFSTVPPGLILAVNGLFYIFVIWVLWMIVKSLKGIDASLNEISRNTSNKL